MDTIVLIGIFVVMSWMGMWVKVTETDFKENKKMYGWFEKIVASIIILPIAPTMYWVCR